MELETTIGLFDFWHNAISTEHSYACGGEMYFYHVFMRRYKGSRSTRWSMVGCSGLELTGMSGVRAC